MSGSGLPLGEWHLRRLVREYVTHYHGARAPGDRQCVDRPPASAAGRGAVVAHWTRRIVGCGVHRDVVDGPGAMHDVQSSDAWPHAADAPQLGPWSAVTTPPMAGESANP